MIRGLRLPWLGGLFGKRAQAKTAAADKERGGGGDEPEEWVTAISVFTIVEAQMALARLADEGIPARSRQDSAHGAVAVTVGIFGRIDILVPRPLLEEARTVLQETLGIDADKDDESASAPPPTDSPAE